MKTPTPSKTGWLLFFYRLPARPVSARMKVWRKLARAGAIQLKGAVYVLPGSDDHREFFQWLLSEVVSLAGEAAFTAVDAVDSMKDSEIQAMFLRHAEDGYRPLAQSLDNLETRLASIRKGSRPRDLKSIRGPVIKLSKALDEIRRVDFFATKTGSALQSRLAAIEKSVNALSGPATPSTPPALSRHRVTDYQGRTWITRKKPFVDRMASAWLIRRFIDPAARFEFLDEKALSAVDRDAITFDMRGGAFTHAGDLCTFEVLVKSFGLKDKAVRTLAEIVHELDLQDKAYSHPEAPGLAGILSGIRKAGLDDMTTLEQGMAVFDMLYLSKAG